MTLKEKLVTARSYIIFIVGLVVAFASVIQIERSSAAGKSGSDASPIVASAAAAAPASPRPLTAAEQEWARIAWKYFENNTQATGLVNSVDKFPATTMWDTGSYLLGLIAAERLGIVKRAEFDDRMGRALSALATMPLFDGMLPNKSYDTTTLAMTNYANQPVPRGIGWSVIDIGRLLVPFNIVVWRYPQHSAAVEKVMARWNVARLTRDGTLYGARVNPDGTTEYLQEGRYGYEQYAAKTFGLMGIDVTQSASYSQSLRFANVEGIAIPFDSRSAKAFGAQNYVVSENYVLDELEFGGDRVSRELGWRVYAAQARLAHRTGRAVAVTEDHLDRPPYFVYNTVYANGKAWNAITDTGADATAFKQLSVKAAFGWQAIYGDDYTRTLMAAVADLNDPARGWFAGRYDADGQPNRAISANTNAIVLESLVFIRDGRMLRY
jgi:hypothetical protein